LFGAFFIFVGLPRFFGLFLHPDGSGVSSRYFLFFEKVHFVVGHAELFLECSDNGSARVHFLPYSLLDDHLGLYQPCVGSRFFLLVDHTADDFSSEFVDELLLCEFLHLGNSEFVVVPLAYPLEVFEVITLGKVVVSLIEPLSLLHFLKGIGILVGVVLYYWLDLPKVRPLNISFVA